MNKLKDDLMINLVKKSLNPDIELSQYEIIFLSNCWEYCRECNGWGVIFLKAGIPNITEPCTACGNIGMVWR